MALIPAVPLSSRKLLLLEVVFTQKLTVWILEIVLGTLTRSSTPSKLNEKGLSKEIVLVTVEVANGLVLDDWKYPVLPFPDQSLVLDPVPSSNFQYPTNPLSRVDSICKIFNVDEMVRVEEATELMITVPEEGVKKPPV